MTREIATYLSIKVELIPLAEDVTTSFIRHDGKDDFWNESFEVAVWRQGINRFRRYYKTREEGFFIFRQFCERFKVHNSDASPDFTIDPAWEPSMKWSPNG